MGIKDGCDDLERPAAVRASAHIDAEDTRQEFGPPFRSFWALGWVRLIGGRRGNNVRTNLGVRR